MYISDCLACQGNQFCDNEYTEGSRSAGVTSKEVAFESAFIQVNTSGVLTEVAITPDGSSALVTTFSSDSPKIPGFKIFPEFYLDLMGLLCSIIQM